MKNSFVAATAVVVISALSLTAPSITAIESVTQLNSIQSVSALAPKSSPNVEFPVIDSVRVDKQETPYALRVSGLNGKKKVFVDFGDGTAVDAKSSPCPSKKNQTSTSVMCSQILT